MEENRVKVHLEFMGWTNTEEHVLERGEDLPGVLRKIADEYEASFDALRRGRLRVDMDGLDE